MRSVTLTSSEGSSLSVIGEKRSSCRAEAIVKERRPLARGSEANVPMQPRRWREEEDIVFQVTKSGDSEIVELR